MNLDPDQFWRQTPATFKAVMSGRAKARTEEIVTLAHQTAVFSRQDKLKRLDHYLKPQAANDGTDERVFASLKALEAKGLVTIREVQ